MKRRLIIGAAVLVCVGCGPQTTRQEPGKFAVGQEIEFPDIIAKDLKGRKYEICMDAQAIVKNTVGGPGTGAQLKAPGLTFPDCLDDQSQVQYVGDGKYAISSWVEMAQTRTAYSGDAVIVEDEGGVPRTLRITRLDLQGGAK